MKILLTTICLFGIFAAFDANAFSISRINTMYYGGNDDVAVLKISSDTTDGSTTFADTSKAGNGGSNHTVTANGQIHHEVDEAKFGATSIHSDGTNDYLVVTSNSDFVVPISGAFTIDFWINFSSTQLSYIFDANSATSVLIQWVPGDNWRVQYAGGSVHDSGSWTPTLDQWYHIALVRREASTSHFYVDGIELYNFSDGSAFAQDSIYIFGRHNNGDFNLDGYLDEIRYSTGISRWLNDFTPPARPYSPTIISN